MFVDLTFEKALPLIGSGKEVFSEIVIPKDFPKAENSNYLPEYDWLYTFGRTFGRVLDKWVRKHRFELIGARGLISEALSNAYCHAHKRDTTKPIFVKIFEGPDGILLNIVDSGKGFDYRAVVGKILKGKKHFNIAGNGLKRAFESERFGIFYNDQGNAFNLIYLFEQASSCISSFEFQAESTNKRDKKSAENSDDSKITVCEADPSQYSEDILAVLIYNSISKELKTNLSSEEQALELISLIEDINSDSEALALAAKAGLPVELFTISHAENLQIIFKSYSDSILVVVLKEGTEGITVKYILDEIYSHFE
jgi:hypothetical protein